jgi:hypothetical protein
MVLASAVSSDRWTAALQVSGMVLFAAGGSGFVAAQLRR